MVSTAPALPASSDLLEIMIDKAAAAGIPSDQLQNFVMGGYAINPAMMEFHAAAREADKGDGPTEIGLGGTRGPGKSYAAMAQVALDDCQRVPELKFLFLRKLKMAAAESADDLWRKVLRYTPHEMREGVVTFPQNGSRIVVGGYKDERDIDKYLGIEYDGAVIEEATQLPEDRIDKVYGSIRTSKPPSVWRPRKYLTTNADGVGLLWFKNRFVLPWRSNRQIGTRYFQSYYYDNPFLNPEYVEWLRGLKGQLAKAWRDCDWDAFAGMAFPLWNWDRHVIKPFEIPDSWVKWRAVDEGYAAPWCCLWLTKAPSSRRIYVYREAYEAELTLVQQARRIRDMTPASERIVFTYADPAMWQKKNKDGKVYTAADQYRDEGVPLTKADNDRIQGKRKVDTLLDELPDGEPGLQIFDICEKLPEQLSTLARDELKPEDVDTDQEDHAYDACRYGLSNEKKVGGPPTGKNQHPLKGAKGL